MSTTLAIEIENLSKQYRLGETGMGSLSQDLNKWWYQMRGKENPYLSIGEENDREKKGKGDYVWSLRDINFKVEQGEIIGVVGRNGAGKSTLLKILSRTTAPTVGKIKIKGKVASLLEVGTGFHPELSGRDNIYLNGAILGMTKNEITRKFDEIVAFSGVERYIDTPVKRYSSGMYVRLAFAVAAHLDSEILILDEVLAVGDADFQKKCLTKISQVSKGAGRTVLFVSHNMTSIQALCNKGVFLDKGRTKGVEGISTIVNKYVFNVENEIDKAEYFFDPSRAALHNKGQVRITKVIIKDNNGIKRNSFKTSEPITITMEWENIMGVQCSPNFQLAINGGINAIIASDAPIDFDGTKKKQPGAYESNFVIPANWLNANNYFLSVALDSHSPRLCYESHPDILKINVWDPMDESSIARGMFTSVREDVVLWPALECSFSKVD